MAPYIICFKKNLQNQLYEAFRRKTSRTYPPNRLMASRLRIGKSSESSKLLSLAKAKGYCMMKGFKMESKTSLSPSNARGGHSIDK